MLVKRTSPFDGVEREMDLPITAEQYDAYAFGNVMIQKAFPNLTADQREFIMTGITPQQWDEIFSDDE